MLGNLDIKEEIVYAISRYDYAHAYKLAQRLNGRAERVEYSPCYGISVEN